MSAAPPSMTVNWGAAFRSGARAPDTLCPPVAVRSEEDVRGWLAWDAARRGAGRSGKPKYRYMSSNMD
ncbi:hypothetical protein [Myxococcus xanthus]|uniref:hypothetical protein n=2 Tax=Myxococcus TaxID=32 RepID=UPI0015A15802|nr:hypothetical protein [Myxococcus xanthus]